MAPVSTPAQTSPSIWTGAATRNNGQELDGAWESSANWVPLSPSTSLPDTPVIFGPIDGPFALNTQMTLQSDLTLPAITFNPGAASYSLTLSGYVLGAHPAASLLLTGDGLVNLSGNTQTIQVSPVGASLTFANTASAGSVALTALGGQGAYYGYGIEITDGGRINFQGNSTAGEAIITTEGGVTGYGRRAITTFLDESSAGDATLITNGPRLNGINGGITQFVDDASGGNATVITNAGGRFDLSSTRTGLSVGSIEGAGEYTLGDRTLTTGTLDTDTTVEGTLSGVGGNLTKVGIGTLTLAGDNTYTGTTTVSSGQLTLTGSLANSTMQVGSRGTLNLLADYTNTGSFFNAGTVNVGNASTFATAAGATLLNNYSGIINVDAGATFRVSEGATYNNFGQINTTAGAILDIAHATLNNRDGTSALRLHGNDVVGGQGSTLDNAGTILKTGAGTTVVASGTTLTNSGTINLQGGSLALATGATFTQTEGTLNLGSGTSLDLGSSTAVFDGGALRGFGTLDGDSTFNSGALIAPGNSIGTLTFEGNTLWSNGASFDLELLSAAASNLAGVANDLVLVSGSLSLPSSGFNLNVSSIGAGGLIDGFDQNQDYAWTFATAGSILGFEPGTFVLDTGGVGVSYTGQWSVGLIGNSLQLLYQTDFTPVPEPSTYAAAGLGICVVFAMWRRRRRGLPPAVAPVAGPGR